MLKCSVCQSMFRLETVLTSGGENQARWMVRNAQGDVLYFPSFDKLYRLIMERKVSAEDEVSRTGKKWTRLADINEFMPVFQVVESILSSLGGQNKQPAISKPPARATPAPMPVPEPRNRAHTIQQFAERPPSRPMHSTAPGPPAPQHQAPQPPTPKAPRLPTPAAPEAAIMSPMQAVEPPPQRTHTPQSPPAIQTPEPPPPNLGPLLEPERAPEPDSLGGLPPEPSDAWSLGSEPEAPELEAPAPPPPKRSRAPLWIALLLVLGLGGGAGYLWFAQPEQAQALLATIRGDARANTPTPPTTTKTPDPPKTTPRSEVDAPAAARAKVSEAIASSAAQASNSMVTVAIGRGVEGVHKAALAAGKAAARKASRSDVGAVLKRASRALSRGDKFKARGLYHDALELEPRNVKAMTGLGWTLISMGKADSASAQFKRAIHFNANFEDAYIGLGKAERQRGQLKSALSAYERYLKRFPSGRKRSIAEHQRNSLRESLGM